jgi:hypothetical protein
MQWWKERYFWGDPESDVAKIEMEQPETIQFVDFFMFEQRKISGNLTFQITSFPKQKS